MRGDNQKIIPDKPNEEDCPDEMMEDPPQILPAIQGESIKKLDPEKAI